MATKFFWQFLYRQPLFRMVVVIFFIFPFPLSIAYPQQNKLYDDLFSVSFPDEREGWASGRWGCVLHTSDGGKTWARQSSGSQLALSSIHFVDSKHGWAVGDQGTILYTGNGGGAWEKQKSPISDFLMDVFFIDALKGWIVAERTTILFTKDGGRTWNKQFSGEDYILKAVSFCDALNGWAVGEYGYIYHTSDGGVSWGKQAGEFRISRETGEIIGGNYLFDIVALDPKTAWGVGIDGYVTRTLDGGRSWQSVLTGVRRTQLFSVTSDRKNRILIGGNQAFLSSSDNGKTWQVPEFRPPITYGWIYGLAPRGNSGFVAVGWKGAIYMSSSDAWQRIKY